MNSCGAMFLGLHSRKNFLDYFSSLGPKAFTSNKRMGSTGIFVGERRIMPVAVWKHGIEKFDKVL